MFTDAAVPWHYMWPELWEENAHVIILILVLLVIVHVSDLDVGLELGAPEQGGHDDAEVGQELLAQALADARARPAACSPPWGRPPP